MTPYRLTRTDRRLIALWAAVTLATLVLEGVWG